MRGTIQLFEKTGAPVISGGEQSKPSFVSYPIHGLETLTSDGVTISFADGHVRRLPVLTAGPLRYRTHAATHLEEAKRHAPGSGKHAGLPPSALRPLSSHNSISRSSRAALLAQP